MAHCPQSPARCLYSSNSIQVSVLQGKMNLLSPFNAKSMSCSEIILRLTFAPKSTNAGNGDNLGQHRSQLRGHSSMVAERSRLAEVRCNRPEADHSSPATWHMDSCKPGYSGSCQSRFAVECDPQGSTND